MWLISQMALSTVNIVDVVRSWIRFCLRCKTDILTIDIVSDEWRIVKPRTVGILARP